METKIETDWQIPSEWKHTITELSFEISWKPLCDNV